VHGRPARDGGPSWGHRFTGARAPGGTRLALMSGRQQRSEGKAARRAGQEGAVTCYTCGRALRFHDPVWRVLTLHGWMYQCEECRADTQYWRYHSCF